jgi:hypothetical protein
MAEPTALAEQEMDQLTPELDPVTVTSVNIDSCVLTHLRALRAVFVIFFFWS